MARSGARAAECVPVASSQLVRRWPSSPGPPSGLRSYRRLAARAMSSTGFIGVVGGFRLPQNLGSSTLALVIAAPGIFRFGPQLSMVMHRGQADHVIVARLDLLLVDHLVGEHGEAGGLGEHRLLDLDLLPALPDQVEPYRARRSRRRA